MDQINETRKKEREKQQIKESSVQAEDDLLPEPYRIPAGKRPQAADVIVIESSDQGQELLQDDYPKFENINVPSSLSDNVTSGNSLGNLVNKHPNNPVIQLKCQ